MVFESRKEEINLAFLSFNKSSKDGQSILSKANTYSLRTSMRNSRKSKCQKAESI